MSRFSKSNFIRTKFCVADENVLLALETSADKFIVEMRNMKKLICLVTVLLMCLCVTSPALAAESNFVPSISYKDHPEILGDISLINDDGDILHVLDQDCLVITPVSEALDKPENERTDYEQKLVEVYEKLSDGSMKLPLDDDWVIRDLFDASLICGEVHLDPNHVEELAKEGVYINLTFDLGVSPNTDVVVMVYINGQWQEIKSVVNNGDGTITGVFEDICPIAFCVKAGTDEMPPYTGDNMGQDLLLWGVVLTASVVALAVLLISRRKRKL